MDIFTTQLTRVLAVPIKPKHLKVKALVKDAGTNKLKDDHDKFDNQVFYFTQSVGEQYYYSDEADHRAKQQTLNHITKALMLDTKTVSDQTCPVEDDSSDEHKGLNLDLYA